MKRFYSDDSEDEDFNIYNEDEEMNAMQLDMAEQQLNQELMDRAIKIAKQSWFWSFKSVEKEMFKIELIYNHLKRILERDEEEE